MPNKYILPVPKNCVITQSWEQHKQRAISNGWSWKPGIPGKTYYYPGVDFAGCGSPPILAAASGKVLEVRSDPSGYGNHVRIDHGDGDMTIYAHLSVTSVRAGDAVKAGQAVGVMGWSGNVWPAGPGGTHLHWELRRKGVPTDPMPMVVMSLPEPDVEPVPTPEPEDQPQGWAVPEIVVPSVKVTALPWLNIRESAAADAKKVGSLQPGDVVKVIDVVRDGADIWLQIGYGQYIAGLYDGDIMVEWTK